MFKSHVLILLLVVTVQFSAIAQTNNSANDVRYITDDLQAFMHSGPGRNYRILGSIVAGTKVTVLQEDQENGFIEIIDDNQRSGWVESGYITAQQSLKERTPQLQASLDESLENISEQAQANDLLNQQLADLTTRNASLVKDLETIKKDNQRIQRELDTQDKSAQMQWFTRGGIIAVVSILLGVIIAYLPKKRRRNDHWM